VENKKGNQDNTIFCMDGDPDQRTALPHVSCECRVSRVSRVSCVMCRVV
jgi:hypothetical protein